MGPLQQYVKSVNTDSRSNRRLRFASAKERSKKASADVYRSYKRRLGGAGPTTASTREASVHRFGRDHRGVATKRHRVAHRPSTTGDEPVRSGEGSSSIVSVGLQKDARSTNNMTAVVKLPKAADDDDDVDNNPHDSTAYDIIDDTMVLDQDGLQQDGSVGDDGETAEVAACSLSTTFAIELDVAIDRNASEIFSKFHRSVWPLVRSLPETLHHLDKIVDLLCSHMLSPASLPERPSPALDPAGSIREEFVVNHATTDILHLLSVLARDLRHELHPYVHTKIIPRIVRDLLNPPLPPPDSNKQPIPLDVTIVEAAFRTLSYIFRYDSNLIVQDMEAMRKYYGMTLGNRRELVRRMSAETFAPQVRKIKTKNGREKHLRRVLRALAATAQQPASRILQRTQNDAVDGLSQLLFQVVRGVHGTLHSQGGPIVRFLLEYLQHGHHGTRPENSGSENNHGEAKPDNSIQQDLVFDVVSHLVAKLCYHFHDSSFVVVTKELFAALKSSVQGHMNAVREEHNELRNPSTPEAILRHLKLIVQVALVRNGALLLAHSDSDLSVLHTSISELCSKDSLFFLELQFQRELMSLLCELWVALRGRECIQIAEYVGMILNYENQNLEFLHPIAVILAKKLCPYLGQGSEKDAISPILLTSAAHMATTENSLAVEIIFSVASSAAASSSGEDADEWKIDFEIFGRMGTGACTVDSAAQKVLLDSCLSILEHNVVDRKGYAEICVAIRCIPFLTLLSSSKENLEERKANIKNSARRLVGMVQLPDNSCVQEKLIVMSLAMEAISFLLLEARDLDGLPSFTKKTCLQLKGVAEQLALSHSDSLWVMRGVSRLIQLMEKQSIQLGDDADAMLDALVSNLGSPNHFLRLYTLRILASYPEKSFVVDHADLDLTNDLDEDESYRKAALDSTTNRGPVGPCDLLKTLLKLEASRVRLVDERHLVSLLGRVEVLARTQRLPVAYAEAAANHMLGLFHVKFSPLWAMSGKTIVALATAHEAVAWPPFEEKLAAVMNYHGDDGDSLDEATGVEEKSFFVDHFDSCRRWEKSRGTDMSLFESYIPGEGEVPCWHVTDPDTVMESVWKAAESGHKVVVKHSRVVVPLFLDFLHNQYFVFYSGSQEARELHLGEVAENKNVDRDRLQGFVLQKRLRAFLGAFAAIEGPQQLVQHKLMENVFRSFLGDQDPSVVELALSCLLKFKPEYLLPYSGLLRDVVQKGNLRSGLLKLAEDVDTGKMSHDHRKLLVPLLARLLFGRVTSRVGKNSKETPAARRAAILSFLSILCQTEDDFFPFLYMMTRSFIPRHQKLKRLESYSSAEQEAAMQSLMGTGSEDLSLLSSGVIEGFLHLLEGVVSQLGYRVISWVPHFTKITLELSSLVSVKSESSSIDSTEGGLGMRRSPIRTLCFQRLGNLFGRFGGAVDFLQFSSLMWHALNPSLELLPEMVVRNEGCPAILLLLQTMSAEPALIRLIRNHDYAVGAVVRCIAPTSMPAVMHSSLTFVENLLSVTDENSIISGLDLVRKYTPLLMEQFTMRLSERSVPGDPRAKCPRTKPGVRFSTWRRELEILFKISGLIPADVVGGVDCNNNVVVLCNLLVPLLQPDQGTSDEDKAHIMGILDGIIGQLDPEASFSVFLELSRSLAPFKSKPGIAVLAIRKSIASLIAKVAKKHSRLQNVSDVVLKLSSTDEKRVDEIDFDTVLPELNSLAEHGAGGVWKSLCSEGDRDPAVLYPLINTCFSFLYCNDGVLARASFNALKALVLVTAQESQEGTELEAWTKLAESKVVNLVRSGIQSRDPQIRRFFILLTREIARAFCRHPSRNLFGDLDSLRNDENHDLDFFLSITHVQIHRRSRAFQRLRKTLTQILPVGNATDSMLTSQSITTILIPLALHPVYECKTKLEESFALDAIASLGALSRFLSWSKYNNLLWTLLSQFDRHPEQERYLIGAMCAVIDGFSFEILEQDEDSPDATTSKSSVWRSLENRILPKVEELLTKETKDKNGSRVKTLRPPIILALMKLFQKFPEEFFEAKLPRILSVICDALRNKDSNARDTARNTLSRMVCSMDIKYLADVIREVTITLNEGYKLHVRAAVMHSILLELSKVYDPPSADTLDCTAKLPFDAAVPAMMDLIQEDLFGEANERRESRETNVRYVKEAGGTKSVHSIEIICKLIAFAPKVEEQNGIRSQSSIHCVVSPMLERLRQPDVDLKTIRKVREVLSRVVIGLSNNRSVRTDQLFPFVYATIQPLIGSDAMASVERLNTEGNSDDDDDPDAVRVSGGKQADIATSRRTPAKAVSVIEWRPSTLKMSGSAATASEIKKEERLRLMKVHDGTSAPKLTGTSRYGQVQTFNSERVNEPASISAVIFGLNLMNACLKKKEIKQGNESVSMLDPFVPLLTACVCHCRDTDVALIALKCLLTFLRLDLPSIPACSTSLGVHALSLLSSSGSSKNHNHDLVQACFKTLTHLISTDKEAELSLDDPTTKSSRSAGGASEEVLRGLRTIPLNGEQMRVLISILQNSIAETEQHNPALGLVRAILSRRYMSPEFYDMMESILKLVVRSQKGNLRHQSAGLFVRYLLDYPMGEERFEQHLKQVVANIGYEYQEGRMSAIVLLTLVVEKVPPELLQKHAQLLFLPLVLQLVNDDSKDCRERVSNCLEVLLKRSSLDTLRTFQEYCVRWSQQVGALRLASLQVFGLIADSRRDLIETSSLAESWSIRLQNQLQMRDKADWETTYFSLIAVEKLSPGCDEELARHPDLWTCISDCLVDPHPWVKLASSRILNRILSSGASKLFLEEQREGLLFEIVRNLTFQLNVNEEEQSEEISELAIKTLTSALLVMKEKPELCYATDIGMHQKEHGVSETVEKRDPVFWILRRLSQIARNKGSKRRIAVFKCYAAFVATNYPVVAPYVELMLEGLHRAVTEAKNEIELQSISQKRNTPSSVFGIAALASTGNTPAAKEVMAPTTEYSTAQDVLRLMEDNCGSAEEFLSAYAAVKRRARDRKEKRKVEEKTAAVQDPQAAAGRKMQKQERNKQRRKRRADEFRRDRGGADTKKRRSHNS